MSVGSTSGLYVPPRGARAGVNGAVGTQNGMDGRLSRLLLRAIDAHDSHVGKGPTVPELAADLAANLGIPPDFGHRDLVGRLQRELSLGRVSYFCRRLRLTRAGRDFVDSGTPRR